MATTRRRPACRPPARPATGSRSRAGRRPASGSRPGGTPAGAWSPADRRAGRTAACPTRPRSALRAGRSRAGTRPAARPGRPSPGRRPPGSPPGPGGRRRPGRSPRRAGRRRRGRPSRRTSAARAPGPRVAARSSASVAYRRSGSRASPRRTTRATSGGTAGLTARMSGGSSEMIFDRAAVGLSWKNGGPAGEQVVQRRRRPSRRRTRTSTGSPLICSGEAYRDGPEERPGARSAGPSTAERLGQPEVADLDPAVGVEEAVGRLDVAVDDAERGGPPGGRRSRRGCLAMASAGGSGPRRSTRSLSVSPGISSMTMYGRPASVVGGRGRRRSAGARSGWPAGPPGGTARPTPGWPRSRPDEQLERDALAAGGRSAS